MRMANVQRSAISRALGKAAAVVVIVIVAAAAGVGTIFATTATTTQTVTQTVNQTITQSATVTSTVTSLQKPTASNTIDLTANSTVFLAIAGGGDFFTIGTLSNPTIKVKAGTDIRIFFASVTIGQVPQHSFVITSLKPPYAVLLSQSNLTPAFLGASTENPVTPERSQFTLYFTADKPSTYYYICALGGHAYDGMYGQFIVEG